MAVDPTQVQEPTAVNGHTLLTPANVRRLATYYKEVELEDEYAGWKAVVRTNPRYSTIEALSDPMHVYEAIPEIVREWNFVDEEGQTVPLTPDGVKILPIDLCLALVAKWNEVRKLPPALAG